MSIVSFPAALKAPAICTISQRRYDVVESSDSTGAEAARLLGPPRWVMSLGSIDAMTLEDAGAWEALVLQLRGRVNHLAMFDPVRRLPRGTLRGSPTIAATAAAGATVISIGNARTAQNLLVNTRALGQSPWVAVNSGTVTANTAAAPDGSTTADTITDPNGAAVAGQRQTITIADDSTRYVASLFVKKTSGGTSPTFFLGLTASGGTSISGSIRIDTDTGAVLAGAGAVVNYSAAYWRVSCTVDNNASGNTTLDYNAYPAVSGHGIATTDNTTTGSAIVWGAQLERGSAPTDYAPATLLPGDWLQIGSGVGTSQLVKVVAPALESAASGTLSVTIEPPLRYGFDVGTVLTVDMALGYYKLTSEPQWTYRLGRAYREGGIALDLLESWA